MEDFRRRVIRLLVFTAFLLLVAWLALKGMQYGRALSLEDMMMEGQSALEGLGRDLQQAIQPVIQFLSGIAPDMQ